MTAAKAQPDTGAQICVGGPELVDLLGTREALVKPALKIRVANGRLGEVLGAFFCTVSGTTPWEGTVVSQEMVYVMSGVSQLYLSMDCTVALGIIHVSYPQLGYVDQGGGGLLWSRGTLESKVRYLFLLILKCSLLMTITLAPVPWTVVVLSGNFLQVCLSVCPLTPCHRTEQKSRSR